MPAAPRRSLPDADDSGASPASRSKRFWDSGYPVRIVRIKNQQNVPAQRDPFWKLVVVTAGTGIHHAGKIRYPVRTGDVFVVRQRDSHGYSETKGLGLCNILFDYDKLGMDRWEARALLGFQSLFGLRAAPARSPGAELYLHLDSMRFRQTVALVEEIEKSMEEKLPCWRMMVDIHFRHLVLLQVRASDTCLRIHDESPLRVKSAIAFLENNFRQRIDLERLLKETSMSRRSFFRIFKQATGESPAMYLIQLRLKNACALLRNTDQLVTQISYESGFSDSNYFTREFRKIIGETPTSYRKRWAD